MLIKTATMLYLWCILIKAVTMLELCILINTVKMLELCCILIKIVTMLELLVYVNLNCYSVRVVMYVN